MLATLGSLIFGAAAIYEWGKDEQAEHRARKSAQQYNVSYYVDKMGRQRWTSNGRKRTAQEIYQEGKERLERQEAEREQALLNEILERAKNDYDLFVIHKDRVSFEEYIAVKLPTRYYERFEELDKIRQSVPEEKKEKMKTNPLYYG